MRALAGALALLACAAAAQAQTSAKLVSNTGQTDSAIPAGRNNDHAQEFTTGGNAAGYMLTRVDIEMRRHGTAAGTFSVSIHARNSSGEPGASLGTLTNPSSLSGSFHLAQFTSDGIALAPSTQYFVVFDVTAAGNQGTRVRLTGANNEDSGKAPGWSIGDSGYTRGATSNTWTLSGLSRQIAVRGYSLSTLVENTDVTPFSQTLAFDYAQKFTTGGGTGGYKLTGVTLALGGGTGTAPTYNVKIFPDSSGSPGTTAEGTLTNPDFPTGLGNREFKAPSGGIDLAASTDYWLVLDVTANANSTYNVYRTTSDSETGKPGWTIANDSRHRQHGVTAWTTDTNPLFLTIAGAPADNVAPAFDSAAVNGTALSVTFDKDLDTGSVPASSAFTVSGGGGRSGMGTATISGKTVSVTLDAAVTSGETVTVSYAQPSCVF